MNNELSVTIDIIGKMSIGELSLLLRYNYELESRVKILEEKLNITNNSIKKEKKKSSKPSWMTQYEPLGYATATILSEIEDNDPNIIKSELDIRYYGNIPYINEIDRERAVRIYCDMNDLVKRGLSFVALNDTLCSVLFDDAQISSMIETKRNAGNIFHVIPLGKGNSYVKQIGCALRRLDTVDV